MEHRPTSQLVHHNSGCRILVPVQLRSRVICKFLRSIWTLLLGRPLRTVLGHGIHQHPISSLGPLRSFRDIRGAVPQQSRNRNENSTQHIVCLIGMEPPNPSQASVRSAVGAMKVCYPRFLTVVVLGHSMQSGIQNHRSESVWRKAGLQSHHSCKGLSLTRLGMQ